MPIDWKRTFDMAAISRKLLTKWRLHKSQKLGWPRVRNAAGQMCKSGQPEGWLRGCKAGQPSGLIAAQPDSRKAGWPSVHIQTGRRLDGCTAGQPEGWMATQPDNQKAGWPHSQRAKRLDGGSGRPIAHTWTSTRLDGYTSRQPKVRIGICS